MSELAESNISLVEGVFIKQMHFRDKGWVAVTHAHVYDHQTLLSSGALRVTVDGLVLDYHAPTIIVIAAGKHHALESLEANTVAYCIHAMTDNAPLVHGIANDDLRQLA